MNSHRDSESPRPQEIEEETILTEQELMWLLTKDLKQLEPQAPDHESWGITDKPQDSPR